MSNKPAGMWVDEPDLPYSFTSHSMIEYNGKLYFFKRTQGGSQSKTCIYDPTTDAWTEGAPIPTVVYEESYVYAVRVGNKVYDMQRGRVCCVYDLDNDVWEKRRALVPQAVDPFSMVAYGKYVYIFNCDYQPGAKYDTETDTFVEIPRSPYTMMYKRFLGCAAEVNGKIYHFNGLSPQAEFRTQIFDTVTETWEYGPPFEGTPQYAHIAVVKGADIYIIGGSGSSGIDLRQVWIFDTLTQTFHQGPRLSSVGRVGHAAAICNNRLYISGGSATYSLSRSLISLGFEDSGGEDEEKMYILVEATKAARLSGTRVLENASDYNWKPASGLLATP